MNNPLSNTIRQKSIIVNCIGNENQYEDVQHARSDTAHMRCMHEGDSIHALLNDKLEQTSNDGIEFTLAALGLEWGDQVVITLTITKVPQKES